MSLFGRDHPRTMIPYRRRVPEPSSHGNHPSITEGYTEPTQRWRALASIPVRPAAGWQPAVAAFPQKAGSGADWDVVGDPRPPFDQARSLPGLARRAISDSRRLHRRARWGRRAIILHFISNCGFKSREESAILQPIRPSLSRSCNAAASKRGFRRRVVNQSPGQPGAGSLRDRRTSAGYHHHLDGPACRKSGRCRRVWQHARRSHPSTHPGHTTVRRSQPGSTPKREPKNKDCGALTRNRKQRLGSPFSSAFWLQSWSPCRARSLLAAGSLPSKATIRAAG